jgi:hypothetical protein
MLVIEDDEEDAAAAEELALLGAEELADGALLASRNGSAPKLTLRVVGPLLVSSTFPLWLRLVSIPATVWHAIERC